MLQDDGLVFENLTQMLDAFDMRWPAVERWLSAVEARTTTIVSAIAAILDPEAVIIGGRIPTQLAEALADRTNYFAEPVRGRERPFPKILAAAALGDPAAKGAASVPLQEHFFR